MSIEFFKSKVVLTLENNKKSNNNMLKDIWVHVMVEHFMSPFVSET